MTNKYERNPEIPKYDMERGVAAVALLAEERLNGVEPLTIGLAAGTGGGKGYFARNYLLPMLRETMRFDVLESDDFFEGPVTIGSERTFDDPECVNLSDLRSILKRVKSGETTIRSRLYDFNTARRDLHTTYEFEDVDGLVVDGIFALHPEVADAMDVKVFVDAPPLQRFLHRFVRDVEERPFIPPRSILPYLVDNYERHLRYVEPAKRTADIAVDGALGRHGFEALCDRAVSLTDEAGEPYVTPELIRECQLAICTTESKVRMMDPSNAPITEAALSGCCNGVK